MKQLIQQWWHGRIKKHYQWSESTTERDYLDYIRFEAITVFCSCGAEWHHEARID